MPYSNIDKGSKYFNTVLYTGDGTNSRAITGVGFQPDWLWIKIRDGVDAQEHVLVDAVRGATKSLESETTDAEETTSTTVASLDSDGFTLGSSPRNRVNRSSSTYVAWNWKANGAGVSNTSGTITSTVSANTTSGFSIVSYTGTGANATVGHGLGVAPKTIFFKRRNTTANWNVYHSAIGATNKLNLNLTDASSASGDFNNTSPTSSVFSVATAGEVNASGSTYIAYCFAEVKGFSKFGSYTGNGNADGTFVYTGFKPAFFLGKNSSNASENWFIFDNKRDTFNTAYRQLFPNTSGLEATNTAQNIDILSNGFKMRSVEARFNESGSTMIYMAFAENPFVSSKGIPTIAR